jgi:DNA-binding Xre family transcriptional regulator
VKALDRPPSDHNPLLLNVVDNMHFGKKKFRFKKWWLEKAEFKGIVKKAWEGSDGGKTVMDKWQFKIRTLRRIVRGWAANEVATMNKTKVILAEEYNKLDELAESRGLSSQELQRLKEVTDELGKIWELEEIKARQRSRERDIVEGDINTAYFQAIANQRSRKKRVSCLMGPNGLVDDQAGMIRIATDFYKNLFAKEMDEDVKLDLNFWDEEDLVTQEENNSLDAPFTEEEIKKAIFSSYSDGAPGPDGLPFLFFQKFWVILKEDLVKLFGSFIKVLWTSIG